MPWANVPEALWPQMERCVKKVMADGKGKRAAHAICHKSIVKSVGKEARKRKGGK